MDQSSSPLTRKELVPRNEELHVEIPVSLYNTVSSAIHRYHTATELPFIRDTGTPRKDYDLKRIILSTAFSGGILEICKLLEFPAFYTVLAGFTGLSSEDVYALRSRSTGCIF